MLLMNGAPTQHQCCCCHKNLYDINKVLAVNREKNSSKQNQKQNLFQGVEGVLEDKLSKFFLTLTIRSFVLIEFFPWNIHQMFLKFCLGFLSLNL